MAFQLKLENQLCFPVYALAKAVVNHYRPILDELSLTYPQYLVLLVLWEQGPQTVGQIGEKLFLDSGTLTPLLKRMEQKKIIARSRSGVDERVVRISLTDKGLLLEEKAMEIPSKLVKSMDVCEEDLAMLKNSINVILNKQK